METPSINHPTDRPNFTQVWVGGHQFYFSYHTVIAVDGKVRKNNWGPTTGKHLNYIDGGDDLAKARRLDDDEFNKLMECL